MSVEQRILQMVRELPLPAQWDVLMFAEFMVQKQHDRRGRANGVLADIAPEVGVSFEEIKAIRREVWGNFPREIAVDQ